jgi:putative Mg2+ transporter-C (MgtC) family protein
MLSWEWMASFWSASIVAANLVAFMKLLGALLLGLVVGHERSYRGARPEVELVGVAHARH